jgi:hypothetical protein
MDAGISSSSSPSPLLDMSELMYTGSGSDSEPSLTTVRPEGATTGARRLDDGAEETSFICFVTGACGSRLLIALVAGSSFWLRTSSTWAFVALFDTDVLCDPPSSATCLSIAAVFLDSSPLLDGVPNDLRVPILNFLPLAAMRSAMDMNC